MLHCSGRDIRAILTDTNKADFLCRWLLRYLSALRFVIPSKPITEIGAGDSCSVAGYKGYFAFPISDMYCGSSKLNSNSAISGIYFYMSANSSEMVGKPVYVDNIQLVTDYKTVK